MANYQLLINDKEINLSLKSVISLNSQINDIAELVDQQSNYSNTIEAPRTRENSANLENIDQIVSNSNLPYIKNRARVIVSGIEISNNGFAIISGSESTINIVVYSGNIDFFSIIEKLNLRDIDLSDMDHTWISSDILGSFANTEVEGWKYPIIDYGGLPESSRIIDPKNLKVAVFFSNIFKRIIANAGFSVEGDILSNDKFLRLILPSGEIELLRAQRWLNARKFSAKLSPFSFGASSTSVDYYAGTNSVDYDLGGLFIQNPTWVPSSGAPLSGITVPEPMWWDLKITITFTISGWTTGASLAQIYFFNGSTGGYYHPGGDGTFTITLEDLCPVVNNLTVPILPLVVNLIGCGISILSGIWSGIPNKKGVYYGSTINIEPNLPDITEKEFVKQIAQIFGLIFRTDYLTKTISIRQFADIVNSIPEALNWTYKMSKNDASVEYNLGKYAQKNFFKYKKDDSDQEAPEGFADGVFTVDNETLDPENEAISIDFSPTIMKKRLKFIDVPLINQKDPVTMDFSVKTEPRILIDDTQDILGDPLIFDDSITSVSVSTDIPLCYFWLEEKTYNLKFSDSILLDNYSSLTRVLNKTKKLVVLMNLTALDFYNLDHFKPIYLHQYSAYFYINKVMDFTGIGLTKVELIRIGSRDNALIGLRTRYRGNYATEFYGQVNRDWSTVGTATFTLVSIKINGVEQVSGFDVLVINAPADLVVGVGIDGNTYVTNVSDWITSFLPDGFIMRDNGQCIDTPADSQFEFKIYYEETGPLGDYGLYTYNNIGFYEPATGSVPIVEWTIETL